MKPVVMLADANVFLRFLRNDHAERSPAAKKLIEEAAAGTVVLRLLEMVVADIFYTLTAPIMKVPRALAARQLSALLQQPGVDIENRSRVLDALGLCETKNIDYGDAALIVAAQNVTKSVPILSYDQDFRRVPEITAFSPVDWLQKGCKLLKQ
jgi:predicted nucleic acid-binding protein